MIKKEEMYSLVGEGIGSTIKKEKTVDMSNYLKKGQHQLRIETTSRSRLNELESMAEDSDDKEVQKTDGGDAFARGRFMSMGEARAASANVGAEESVANESVQGGRRAFADIAYQTVSGLGALGPGFKNRGGNHYDDLKLTVGSIGITQDDSASVDQPTIDGAGTTQPPISHAFMTNMMNMHNTTSPIIAAIQIIDKEYQTTSEVNSHNLAFQQQPSLTKRKNKTTTLASSELTKAEVSLTNTDENENESLFQDTSKQGIYDPRITSKSVLTKNSPIMRVVAAPVEGAERMQLPFLSRGPARQEANSSALLHFQPSNNSLTQEMQVMNANLQSQSPLRSIGLDFDADGKQQKSSGAGAGFFAKHAALNSTMPPLKSQIIPDSMYSSKQQLKGRRSRLDSPAGSQLGTALMETGPKTPGQNWEKRGGGAPPAEISVQEFLQMQKISDLGFNDQSRFLNKFEFKDLVVENSKRNSQLSTTLPTGTDKGTENSTMRVREFASKTPFMRDIADHLFNTNSKTTATTPSKSVFAQRSRSVLSPAAINAYTPLAKKSIPGDSRNFMQKRHSTVLKQKQKQEIRQLGYIKPAHEEGLLEKKTTSGATSPHINFPTTNVVIKKNQDVEMKKTLNGFVGQHRFEDGEKALSMPSQVIEQWLDAVLKEEQIKPTELAAAHRNSHGKNKMQQAEDGASKASVYEDFGTGLGPFQKVSEQRSASVRYGLDYQSLSRNGLSKDQITRLHRAIYVHTHGFYNTVKDVCQQASNKKNIIVGVMKVYQQLLERCHSHEWKMLINEVANAFEDEDIQKNKDQKQVLDKRDKMVANLNREISHLHDLLGQKETQMGSEKENFQRLHETYMILQHHNEESLTMRLMTEERLKALFQRERDQIEVMRRNKADHQEDQKVIAENDETIDRLETRLLEVQEIMKDKDGMHRLITGEMQAQKRNYQVCKDKLSKIEGPYRSMQQQHNGLKLVADTAEADSKVANIKTRLLESQVDPLMAQIQLLTNENASLKDVVKRQEQDNAEMSKKMHETLKELSDRTRTFFTAEEQLRIKNQKMAKLDQNLRSTTLKMNAYDLEKQNLSMRMYHADEKLKSMTQTNDQLTEMIDKLDRHENKREAQLIAEKDRNERIKNELLATEEKLSKFETTTLFVLQNNIKDGELRINKLENEVANLQLTKDQDRRFHKDEKMRMHKQIENLDKLNINYRVEVKQNATNESRYRFQYKDTKDKNSMMTIEISTLKNKVATFDEQKAEHNARLTEQNSEITELKATIQMHENLLIEKKAKWKSFKAQHGEGQDHVRKELDKAEDRQKQAISANIMIGEDFRSQALNSYHKVLNLQEVICFLKGEPEVHKQRFVALLSQLRRETERNKMAQEEHRQEILRLIYVIEGRDNLIAQHELRHSQDQYLVQVMRNMIDNDHFDIAHQQVQTEQIVVQRSVQTMPNNNHVAIQAFAYRLRDTQQQTENQVPSCMTDEERDTPIHMPAKKIIKKKGKKKKGSLARDDSQGSIKRLDTKSNQHSPAKSSPRKPSLNSQKSFVSNLNNTNLTTGQKATTRAQSNSPTRLNSGVQSFVPQPIQRAPVHAQTTQNSHSKMKKLQKNISSNSGSMIIEQQSPSMPVSTANINVVEEESEMLETAYDNGTAGGSTSLSNPSKFKLENRQMANLGFTAVPEDLATKSVRQGVFWQMSGNAGGKKGEESRRKKESKSMTTRAQQMRGLIRSAVNRDLD